MNPPVRLSYTRAKELSCPFKYYQLNILGADERKADFTTRGTTLHAVAAQYIRRLSKLGRPRASRIFWKIFSDHTRYTHPEAQAEMAAIAETWCNWFKLPEHAGRVLTEHEMAVSREGHPLEMADALNPNGTAKLDCYTGIADCLIETPNGAQLYDWKMGNDRFDVFEARRNRQLAGYAWLWLKHNPECEAVNATLYAPKFNSPSEHQFKWPVYMPVFDDKGKEIGSITFDDYLAKQFAKADRIRQAGKWPARVHYRDACGFCRLDCPLDDVLYPKEAA